MEMGKLLRQRRSLQAVCGCRARGAAGAAVPARKPRRCVLLTVAGRFAAALRRQGASLASLRLGGASGVTDRHLASLASLTALTWLCLAGVGGAISATLLAEAAAGCRCLRDLDISGASDACLAAAAAMPSLRQLSAAGCGGLGAGAGAPALAAGPAAATLCWLDIAGTSAGDTAAAALAAGCRQLRGVNLTG